MAGTDYTMLRRVTKLAIGPYGSAEGACTDIGAVVSAEFGMDASETNATDATLYDSVVKTVLTGKVGALAIDAQYFTMSNVARMTGGSVSGNRILMGSPSIATGTGEPDYFTAYVHGFEFDGITPMLLHVKKFYIKPGTKVKLSKDQANMSLTAVCLADVSQPTGEEIAAYDADAVDTTPPTVTSWVVGPTTVVPGTPGTGIAKTGIVPIVLTFSEPVRADMVANRVAVFNGTTGADIAGTWAYDATAAVYTFTPTSAFGASTVVEATAGAGVKDLAGNASVSGSRIKFTCAS